MKGDKVLTKGGEIESRCSERPLRKIWQDGSVVFSPENMVEDPSSIEAFERNNSSVLSVVVLDFLPIAALPIESSSQVSREARFLDFNEVLLSGCSFEKFAAFRKFVVMPIDGFKEDILALLSNYACLSPKLSIPT